MGIKLCYRTDEVRPRSVEEKALCVVCGERIAMWDGRLLEEDGETAGELEAMCGHCLMYSERSAYAQPRKDDLLHVGRLCQAQAVKSGKKTIPHIDQRGRLEPHDADNFMLGVTYTSKLLHKSGFGKMLGLVSDVVD